MSSFDVMTNMQYLTSLEKAFYNFKFQTHRHIEYTPELSKPTFRIYYILTLLILPVFSVQPPVEVKSMQRPGTEAIRTKTGNN